MWYLYFMGFVFAFLFVWLVIGNVMQAARWCEQWKGEQFERGRNKARKADRIAALERELNKLKGGK